MITVNILQRVLFVRNYNSLGTSFTIEVNGKSYLISAKHIFSEVTKKVNIEIFKDNVWQTLTVEPIFCDNQIDIIAFKLEKPITPQFELIPSRDKLVLSQDAYFLGFPYGLKTDSLKSNNGYPVPFVKKCIISAMDKDIIYLDGHNNKGFSGGPVCFIHNETKKMHVAGVVSSYVHDLDSDKTSKGIFENSGIFIAHPIEFIIKAIEEEEKKTHGDVIILEN